VASALTVLAITSGSRASEQALELRRFEPGVADAPS